MKGVMQWVTGLLLIACLALAAGPVVDRLTRVVETDAAVQSHGWGHIATSLQSVVLQWAIFLFLLASLIWGVLWAMRREKSTGVRRR